MAYDQTLAERIRGVLTGRSDVTEKKMFGGLAFMLSGNMCCGVLDNILMARVGPEQYREALEHPHAREMDFTGKPLRGFVYVSAEGIESDGDLRDWVTKCERFARSLPPK